jgi:ribonuclease VapC
MPRVNKIVFDSSAVLALVNQEPGHLSVEKYLQHSVISSVNFSEVVTVMCNLGMMIKDAESFIKAIMSEIVPFDIEQAVIAASLRKETKQYGLSLGDRACLALGKSRKLPVLTADRIWLKTKLDLDIRLIRE